MKLYILCVSFLMTCAFAFAPVDQIQAQNAFNTYTIYEAPAGTYVSVEEAEIRLKAEMTDLKGQMANQTPGTLGYNENKRKLAYFKSITDHLKSGEGVADSIGKGLGAFASAINGKATLQQKIALKDLAIDILSA